MFRERRVAVVIPAFNEELNVARTVRDVPAWVDHVLVVDDASHDATFLEASRLRRRGLEVLRHPRNRGVGAAIATGYRRALALGVDAAAVMAGDGQMDPADLPALLAPVVDGTADYVKGNRFAHPDVWRVMPPARIAGNVALSLATKLTSGYWRLFDSQCGYTVASRRALAVIDAAGLFPRYGYPNDLLARLRAADLRVEEAPVRAIYGEAWRSGISLGTVVYPISFVLVRSWLRRLGAQYLGRTAPPVEPLAPSEPRPPQEDRAECVSAS